MTAERKEQERLCPSCGHGPLVARLIRDEFVYGPADERIVVVAENVPVLTCATSECEEVLYGPEAAAIRHRAICRALRLLTPEEITDVRLRLGKGRSELARLMGIEEDVLSRCERGRLIQTRALDNLLRVLESVAGTEVVAHSPSGNGLLPDAG